MRKPSIPATISPQTFTAYITHNTTLNRPTEIDNIIKIRDDVLDKKDRKTTTAVARKK